MSKTGLLAMTPDPTAALYHSVGFRTGVFDEDMIKDWAYGIILQRDTPPISIIEVATAPNRYALFDALSIASNGGDMALAMRLLLDHLHRELSADRISTVSAVAAADSICNATAPFEAAHSDFLILNEDIFLDEEGIVPFSGDRKERALSLLREHGTAAPPTDTPSGIEPGLPSSRIRNPAEDRSAEVSMNATAEPQSTDRPIDRWLAKYSSDHVNATNQKIHFVAVPLILWTVTALLWCIPVPGTWFGPGFWAAIAAFAAWMFYYRASRKLGLGMLVVFVAMLWLNRGLQSAIGTQNLLWLAIAVFVLAWIAQFIGHKIEGRKPSFFTDLVYLLIGPVWTLGKLYRKLGWSY